MTNATIEKVKEFISTCESNRLSQLDNEIEKDEEYQAISELVEELYGELKDAIPESLIPVLNRYEDLLGDLMFTRQNFYYKHGFIDASVMFDTLFGSKKDIKLDIKFL